MYTDTYITLIWIIRSRDVYKYNNNIILSRCAIRSGLATYKAYMLSSSCYIHDIIIGSRGVRRKWGLESITYPHHRRRSAAASPRPHPRRPAAPRIVIVVLALLLVLVGVRYIVVVVVAVCGSYRWWFCRARYEDERRDERKNISGPQDAACHVPVTASDEYLRWYYAPLPHRIYKTLHTHIHTQCRVLIMSAAEMCVFSLVVVVVHTIMMVYVVLGTQTEQLSVLDACLIGISVGFDEDGNNNESVDVRTAVYMALYRHDLVIMSNRLRVCKYKISNNFRIK